MILKKINLVNFRNYQQLQLEPHFGVNIITGANAQGKTNLLEAIFLSCTGFSFRFRDKDVVKWGFDHASLKATYQLRYTTFDVDLSITKEGKKKYTSNNALSNTGFSDHGLGVVLFRPDDLQIIKGSPAQRRDFIDFGLGLIDNSYIKLIHQYKRVVTQRNNLLRLDQKQKSTTYDIWQQQFYHYGAMVLSKRLSMLKMFFPLVRASYRQITGTEEQLEMKYLSSTTLSGSIEAEELINDFAKEGKAREKEEFSKRQTLFGPHRDDLAFLINRQSARYFGSQGQIRSVVLALKMAQIKLIQQQFNEYPIVLLDDVLMELDTQRQNYLLQMVNNDHIQTFITTTILNENITVANNRIYLINKGILQ